MSHFPICQQSTKIMLIWVIYDISKNKARQRVAKHCRYYGLRRVQKSVFLGKAKKKWITTLHAQLAAATNPRTDRVFIVPMSEASLERVLYCGANPQFGEIARDENIVFV